MAQVLEAFFLLPVAFFASLLSAELLLFLAYTGLKASSGLFFCFVFMKLQSYWACKLLEVPLLWLTNLI